MTAILSPDEIKAADAYTIANEPITSIDLMERAAKACSVWITTHFARDWKIVTLAGPGNNGGDGLAIARHLHDYGHEVSVFLLSDKLSPDAATNLDRLRDITVEILDGSNFPELTNGHIVIDALFGSGLSRPLDGLAAQTVNALNKTSAKVVSIDIPSGLFCDDNRNNTSEAIVHADVTLTLQQAKLSMLFAENERFVGKWHVIDIGLMLDPDKSSTTNYITDIYDINNILPRRRQFAHKGDFGHACIIAGSRAMMGAAVLSVRACLRSGAGLVTAHIPGSERLVMQLAAPEALVSTDPHADCFSQVPDLSRFNALAIGPGLGKSVDTREGLLTFLRDVVAGTTAPHIVLDADALNIVAESDERLSLLPKNCIITPHPKEFDRLCGSSPDSYTRWQKQCEIAKTQKIIVVLKGAFTSVATPQGKCYFNTTGNAGMATGGSGDVLTGIIAGMLAQGLSPARAAIAGVWLHGRAGDVAAQKYGQHGMTAGDIVEALGDTWRWMENKNIV